MPISKFSRKEHKARAMLLGAVFGRTSHVYRTTNNQTFYDAETMEEISRKDWQRRAFSTTGQYLWILPPEVTDADE